MKRGSMVLAFLLASSGVYAADDGSLRGFTRDAAAAQHQREATFSAIPDPSVLRETMRRLSARPHHVGSAYGKTNAEWILERFQEWGWDAKIESFGVLFPTPKERVLEMVEPTRFVARLQEPALANDPTSAQLAEQLPTYNAYSVDGDVTAPVVFVNYGLPEDYERLERLGVSVKGAIAIARYGRSWRGIKPKVAAEHGAVGCLIYRASVGSPTRRACHGGPGTSTCCTRRGSTPATRSRRCPVFARRSSGSAGPKPMPRSCGSRGSCNPKAS